MAIKIKAVQCPNCGSSASVELKKDHFRCESCGSDYILDDGQVRNPDAGGPKVVILGRGFSTMEFFGVVFGFCVIVTILLLVAFLPGGNYSHATVAVPARPSAVWRTNYSTVYLSAARRPIVVAMGSYTTKDGTVATVFFIDALTDSMIKRLPIPGGDRGDSEGGWHFQAFSNGDLYAEKGGAFLYKIDVVGYSLSDVTQQFGADQPELGSGIAKVEFIPGGSSDGFHVVTNDGKAFYYFPFLHKVYKQSEFFLAQVGMNTVLPSAKSATGYFFSIKRTDEDSNRLIKIRYLDNGVGPKRQEFCEWQANGEPGPLKPNFERVVSRVNFTPGRLYFSPQVVYSDEEYVLIAFSPTVSGNGGLLQCLDAQTAAIVFTARLDQAVPAGAVRFSGGFAIYDGWVELVDMKGKLRRLRSSNQ